MDQSYEPELWITTMDHNYGPQLCVMLLIVLYSTDPTMCKSEVTCVNAFLLRSIAAINWCLNFVRNFIIVYFLPSNTLRHSLTSLCLQYIQLSTIIFISILLIRNYPTLVLRSPNCLLNTPLISHRLNIQVIYSQKVSSVAT